MPGENAAVSSKGLMLSNQGLMVDIQGFKFPGYGRCIYCGSVGPLKDEHIIPFSLGGRAVIEAASCGDCEKVTSYLDGIWRGNDHTKLPPARHKVVVGF